jgi:hypothetical protein
LSNGDGVATSIEFAQSDITIARFRDPYFQLDDPINYISDWHKMDISRPKPDGTKGTPINTRLERRVAPLLKDYFQGEIYHAPPARYPTNLGSTYHDDAKAAIQSGKLTLSATKYKPMDWRGILDNPEAE